MQIKLSVRDIRRVNNDDGSQYGELVRFQAPEAPENAPWTRADGVPSASLDLYITNAEGFGKFPPRGEYVFDITPVAAVEAPAPEPAPSPEPVPTEQPTQ